MVIPFHGPRLVWKDHLSVSTGHKRFVYADVRVNTAPTTAPIIIESLVLVISTASAGGVVVSTALSLSGDAALTLQSLEVLSGVTLVVTVVGIVVQAGVTTTGDLGSESDRPRPEISAWSVIPTAERARERGEVLLERRDGTFSDDGFEPRN